MSPTPTVVGERSSLEKGKQHGLTRFGSQPAEGHGQGEQSSAGGGQAGEKEDAKDEADEGVEWKPAGLNLLKFGVLLLLTFWIISLWFFGSEYKLSEHLNQLGCVVVDLDGGPVGSALLSAVAQFQGSPTSPTYDIKDPATFTLSDAQKQVWHADVWCALVANAGASARYNAAIAPGSTTAESYDPTTAYTYIANQARFPTQFQSYVEPALTNTITIATETFAQNTVAPALVSATAGRFTTAQAAVLLQPVSSTFDNQRDFQFGSTTTINTIGMVLPQLLQFYFLQSYNSISQQHKLFGASFRSLFAHRLAASTIWTLVTSLSVAGWTYAYHESYHMAAKNFVALWMSDWILALITFDIFDIFATVVPAPVLPLPVTTWLILSVAATATPVELDYRFFRVHWFFPSHSVWLTQITIYSQGAQNRLYQTLPILAAWFVVARLGAIACIKKRQVDFRKEQ